MLQRVLIVALVSGLLACQQTQVPNEWSTGVETDSIPTSGVAPKPGAGGGSAPDGAPAVELPHSKNFMTTKQHGLAANAQGLKACTICHRSEKPTTTAGGKTYKNCIACHQEFPHKAGFKKQHAAKWFKIGEGCLSCHAESSGLVNGVRKIPACVSCHAGYPHERGFGEGKVHGNAFLNDKRSCLSCHGEDLGGAGSSEKSCSKCHVRVHTPEFAVTARHGAEYLAGRDKCWQCHDQKKPGTGSPTGKRSCALCHESYPHEGFSSGVTHGASYFKNSADCVTCHGADFKGKGHAPGCVSCHSFPHASQWAQATLHGAAFVSEEKKAATTDPSVASVGCKTCHFKKSAFSERHPSKFIACDSCHHFHFEPGYTSVVPPGMNSHIFFARQPANGCTACHKAFKAHMPHQKGEGCLNCHKGSRFVIEWRDATLELAPKPKPAVRSR